MIIFDGKKEAEKILIELKEEVSKAGITPRLDMILVGENKASQVYVGIKQETGKIVGIEGNVYSFKANVQEKEILDKIKELNEDLKVNGILVQLPLPKSLDVDKIISAISPKKDVDGFHLENRSLLKSGNPHFYPVLPLAIFQALASASLDFQDKKISAIVNSDLFGNTLQDFFGTKKIKLSVFKRDSIDFSETKNSDIIISVCGCPGLIKGEFIKEGVILIDAGLSYTEDDRVLGDVDKDSVAKKASFLTPPVGGIGPLTVAFLLKNVYLSAKRTNIS